MATGITFCDKSWQIDAKAKHFVMKILTEGRIGTLFWRRFIKTLLFKAVRGCQLPSHCWVISLTDSACEEGVATVTVPTVSPPAVAVVVVVALAIRREYHLMTSWLLGGNTLHWLYDHPLFCAGCQGRSANTTQHFGGSWRSNTGYY